MLKFANVAKVGDVIRAYDFKPMVGRSDCFVEGTVLAIDDSQGYKAFKIRVSKDVFDNKNLIKFCVIALKINAQLKDDIISFYLQNCYYK